MRATADPRRMKLLTFALREPDAKPRIGAWLDGDIVDVEAALRSADPKHAGFGGSLRALIAAGPAGVAAAKRGVDAAARTSTADGRRLPREKVRISPPVVDPHLCFRVGHAILDLEEHAWLRTRRAIRDHAR